MINNSAEAPATEKTTLINYFTLVASLFFAVCAAYYFRKGNYLSSYLYTAILAGFVANFVFFKHTRNEALALSILAGLGLPVLLSWQINGGVAGAGIFWYYIYVMGLFSLLGRSRTLAWTAVVFIPSIGAFVLQQLGHLPTPYTIGTMLSFYFGFILEAAILFVAQATKEKADRLIIEEKTKLQAILDNVAEGIVVSALDGRFIFSNTAAKKIVGIDMTKRDTAEWQKTYGVFEIDKITPVPVHDLLRTKALKGEVTQTEEYIKNTQTNEGTFVLVNGSPLRDSGGRVVGGIATFSDITARQEAALKVLSEKTKAEAILGSIGDGVLAVDVSGKITVFNQAAVAMTGISLQDALNKTYKQALPFYNQKGALDHDFIATALSGQRADMPLDTTLKRTDGTSIPVADSAAPVISAGGHLEGAVIVFRDVTREKQLERMKDEFLSVASHELRTPMGAVRANLSMILSGDYGPVNKDLVEPLTDMKASTVRLVDLVGALLDVARIEAGRMKFTLSNFDIQEAIRSVVSSLAPLGKERDIQISFAPGKNTKVQADIDKIKQVLTNLIGNSLKFIDKGSITITTSPQESMVEIAVTDTGIGIAPQDQKKLFSKFNQITSAQEGKPVGTGLGLYVSREFMLKMGGDLTIKSSVPGKGSTFVFTIPRSESANAEQAMRTLGRESELHIDET